MKKLFCAVALGIALAGSNSLNGQIKEEKRKPPVSTKALDWYTRDWWQIQ